jgi:hypothetical protein
MDIAKNLGYSRSVSGISEVFGPGTAISGI